MLILLALAALFYVMAGFLLAGKGAWMIAGFNTMGKGEKERWNRRALCRAMGVFMLAMATLTALGAFFIREDWMGRLYATGIVGGSVFMLIHINTSKRFKK